MKIGLIILLFIHGLIHFIGFAKAFKIGDLTQFSMEIAKSYGIIWLATGLIFILTAVLFISNIRQWFFIGIIAVIISQALIIVFWKDAKFGTIANLIILVSFILSYANQHFEKTYKNDVEMALKMNTTTSELVTEKDLEVLPPVVQKYLRYVGVVGKPKIHNMRLTFEGEMRDKEAEWFKFSIEQYNFFNTPGRYFFMKAKVNGLPTTGYHKYEKNGADMNIKILSLFPIIHMNNQELFTSETVTFFNELCLFAPAALINDEIEWEALNELSVKASYKAYGKAISATLFFNEKGQLVNFVSHDRYAVVELKTFPYSTPVKNHKTFNGLNLPSYGEAIWHYPDGEFVYGKFYLKSVTYNVAN